MNNIQTYINSMKMSNYHINKGRLGEINNSISAEKEVFNKEDSIEINQKNSLLINTKKACDALEATSKEIGKTSWGGYDYDDIRCEFFTICDYMETKGIKIPNFICDSNEVGNNNDYLGFIERVEEFVRTDPDLKDDYPDKFFDFTKLFKEKLIQFGCK